MKICRAGPQLVFIFDNQFFRHQACYSLLPARPDFISWQAKRLGMLVSGFGALVLCCMYLHIGRRSKKTNKIELFATVPIYSMSFLSHTVCEPNIFFFLLSFQNVLCIGWPQKIKSWFHMYVEQFFDRIWLP
jgi:hypothetical protein